MTNVQKFDFSVQLLKALLWQYEDAKHLQSLLSQKNQWYEEFQSQFWQNWYHDVFHLDTANEFGLSVWSIILDVPLTVGIAGTGARPVWGVGSYNGNFSKWDNHEGTYGTNFGRNGDAVFGVSPEQKRLILKLRYYQLISRGSVLEVNQILSSLFGKGAYVLDGLDMTFRYIFTFKPPAKTLFVLEQFDILPRPAGVQHDILIMPHNSFGHDPYYLNYNTSNFHH
ncbi:DUF2612 domain-containing protein [Bartonella tamiae]|uniref:DUF2612 domain-containing protein n=1 Tax=Bartonella tamiae Th239 TaxID=1094558 RepID=J0R0S4_9HYPH|nr:DUF2612 domain-containing protein [Bartonella tamiae]EJF89124.1 hypothetical protein ME5_01675 [Bartonella tamiae Th239]EJF95473.1 hypothetical protein MEG_00206 [Bartonella tamiae Th307]